jgi:hypothetical protein
MLSAYAFQTLEKQIEKSTKKQIYFGLDNTYHDVKKLNKLLLEDFRSFVKFFFYFVNKIEYKLGSRGETGHAVKLMQVLQDTTLSFKMKDYGCQSSALINSII